MKNYLLSLLLSFLFCQYSFSQFITSSPTCTKNATGWTIQSITASDYSTKVKFKFYTSNTSYKFFVNENMYIQKYDCSSCTKYYISSFESNVLNTWYNVDANTTYYFTFKFDALPRGLTNISIIEPNTEDYTGWYWKNITIDNPTVTMKNFFKYEGNDALAALAHPFLTRSSGTYQVEDDYVYVVLKYTDGTITKLTIERDGSFFTSITVTDDNNDWASAFEMIETMKDLIYKAFQEESTTNQSTIVKKIGTTFYNMTGSQMACVSLTCKWLDF